MAIEDERMTYGYKIVWHTRDTTSLVTVEGHKSERAARLACLRAARRFGWTKPKWWQWWRRGDTTHKQALGLSGGFADGR